MVVVALSVLALVLGWLFFFNGAWRGNVAVVEAELRAADRIALLVDSCGGNPEVSLMRETAGEVQVEVVASSSFLGGADCLDVVEVQLQEPLGDRLLLDVASGQSIAVSR